MRLPSRSLGHRTKRKIIHVRHEVAERIVWQSRLTRPAVPSAVPYEVWRGGNESSKALGQRTRARKGRTLTARGGCLCQHQAEAGKGGRQG